MKFDSNLQTAIDRAPAPGLVLLSIIAIQLGSAAATQLFPILGVSGTVAVRIVFSALLLTLVAGNKVLTFAQTFKDNWQLLFVFGLCIASMNLFFYQSIARIPLGTAVAIEFIGPLGVAAFTSRRLMHFAWIGLAALGVVLLSPLSGVDLDSLGIVFAMLAGASWALFVVLAALTVALLSTTIPLTLEFQALKRLSSRSYGILLSLEPGFAALVGVMLLGERIGLQGLIALACVMIAAIGISLTDKQTGHD